MKQLSMLAVVAVGLVAFLSGCGLDVPHKEGGLRILLAEQPSDPKGLLASSFFSGPSVMTGPSATSDFTCFAVNVTGSGIGPDSRSLAGCTTADNMHGQGFGVISKPVAKGVPIDLDIPGGKGRVIDVYGVYPAVPECGGAAPMTQPGQGFFMGSVTKDLIEATTVTVPVAFASGTPASVTCTGPPIPNIDMPVTVMVKPSASACLASASVNSSAPAPGSGMSSFTNAGAGAQFLAMTSPDGVTNTEDCYSGTQLPYVEFRFNVDGINVSNFAKAFLLYRGIAGTESIGSCASSNSNLSDVGAYVDVWNNASSTWVRMGNFAAVTGTQNIGMLINNPANYVFTSGAGGKYLVMRVVGTTPAAGYCDFTRTDFVNLHLEH